MFGILVFSRDFFFHRIPQSSSWNCTHIVNKCIGKINQYIAGSWPTLPSDIPVHCDCEQPSHRCTPPPRQHSHIPFSKNPSLSKVNDFKTERKATHAYSSNESGEVWLVTQLSGGTFLVPNNGTSEYSTLAQRSVSHPFLLSELLLHTPSSC